MERKFMKKHAVVDSLALIFTIFLMVWMFITSGSIDLLRAEVLAVYLWPLVILVLGLIGWQVWARVVGSWYEKGHHIAADVYAAFCLLASLVVLAARSGISDLGPFRPYVTNVGLLGNGLDGFLMVRDPIVFYFFIVVLLAHSGWVWACARHGKAS
jgi:hypothetical protein